MSITAAYQALLREQWKHQRVEITALVIAAAAACPVCFWITARFEAARLAWTLIGTGDTIAYVGSGVAIFTGLLLAIRPYLLDARSRHTYALALPVPRARYALLRVATGLTLTLVPVAAFLIGALVAAMGVPANTSIHAYPLQLTIRFLLACVLTFSLGFGLQYGLGQRAARWLTIVLLTVGGAEIAGQLAMHVTITGPFWELLAHEGSPLRVFLSSWTLFNV